MLKLINSKFVRFFSICALMACFCLALGCAKKPNDSGSGKAQSEAFEDGDFSPSSDVPTRDTM